MLLALVAGLAYGFSFPKWNLWPLLPAALWVLFDQFRRSPDARSSFLLPFFFSLTAHAVLLYWVVDVLITYGDTGWLWGLGGLLLLLLYMGLVWGLWGFISFRLLSRHPLAFLLGFPALWVLRDLLVETLLTGFPWCRVGLWTLNLPLWPQWASLGGVHFLSFTLVLALLLLPRPGRSWRHPYSLALLVLLGFLALGGSFLQHWNNRQDEQARVSRIGVLQPNATLEHPLYGEKALRALLNDSATLAHQGAEWVVWPEYSVERVYPFQNPAHFNLLARFSRQQAGLLACFNHQRGSDGVFNTVLLLHKGVAETYAKHHLVPFGEYIPYREVFSFVDRISSGVSDYTPGDGPHILRSGPWPAATPICFEILFPELVRQMVAQGGTVLLNPSNDAWYGTSSAPAQLLMMSRVRAIENRRWLVRATTTGYSALIAPDGTVRHTLPTHQKAQDVWNLRIRTDLSPFTRWGGHLLWFFVALGLLSLLTPFYEEPRSGASSTDRTPAADAGLLARILSGSPKKRRDS